MSSLVNLTRSAAASEPTRKALRCLLGCVLRGAAVLAAARAGRGVPGPDSDRTAQ